MDLVRLGLHNPSGGSRKLRTEATEYREGLWGRLEIHDIAISPFEVAIPGAPGQRLITPWVFEQYTPARLLNFLRSLDLTLAQRDEWLDTNAWLVAESGITLYPSDESILALSPANRLRLYAVLGTFPANRGYFRPWSMKTKVFARMLQALALPPAVRDLIRHVAYAKGDRTFVTDAAVILNQLTDDEQRRQAMHFLTSASTFQVDLDIPPGADVEALAEYWGKGDLGKDIKPILISLSQLPEGGKIDIAHLLPAFARQRLYIYPEARLASDGVRRDCHWTSLNFYFLKPDDRFGNSDVASRYVKEHFVPTREAPRFGDLAFFTLPGGGSIHSAVVLAGGLAFTKNGEEADPPWLLMDVDEIRDLYSQYYHDRLDLQYWRAK